MNKIIIPQSNTNDEYVFISEWKIDNNEFVNKGDHVLSIETSKVVEEIYSDNTGYLEKLFDLNSKVKVGEVVAILNENKGIIQLRGNWHNLKIANKNIKAMPIYHPAFLLSQPSRKREAWEDLKKIKNEIDLIT